MKQIFDTMTRSPLFTENEGVPAGGTPPTPPPAETPVSGSGPDIAKMLEQMSNNFTKSLSDMRKEMQDTKKQNDDRMRLIVDDILEVTTNQPKPPSTPAPTSSGSNSSGESTSTTSTAAATTEEAINMATIVTRRKLAAEQEARKVLEQQIIELTRDNRQTKIESSINSAMAKLQWADGQVSDLVASQMIQKAEIDADGKVKIGGADPGKFITDYWTQARWAQPAPVSSGSGNAGNTVRRNDGSIDLGSYDPAKVDPKSDDFKRLIDQAKRSVGMTT